MRCIELATTGGPEVLRPAERPDPVPAADEVLVRVAAAGVNYIDIYHRSGLYPLTLPAVPGLEGAGTVVATGAAVRGFAPGDRVAWANHLGSYAQQVAVPAARLVQVPEALSLEQAAAAMLQGMTAHVLAHSTCPLEAGDAVLVHAAAGGVGRLLTQFLAARGVTVIATVSSDGKAALARSAGATHVIRYDQEDFSARARALTDGAGVRAVYDAVGRATFAGSLDALARRGWLVLYGQASGAVTPVDPLELLRRGSLVLTRPSLFDYVVTTEELADRARALFDALCKGALELRIEAALPLAQAARAHELLAGRSTAGKLLLLP